VVVVVCCALCMRLISESFRRSFMDFVHITVFISTLIVAQKVGTSLHSWMQTLRYYIRRWAWRKLILMRDGCSSYWVLRFRLFAALVFLSSLQSHRSNASFVMYCCWQILHGCSWQWSPAYMRSTTLNCGRFARNQNASSPWNHSVFCRCVCHMHTHRLLIDLFNLCVRFVVVYRS